MTFSRFNSARAFRRLSALAMAAVLLGVFLVPGAAAAAPAPVDTNAYAARVVQLTNVERAKVSLPALVSNAALTTAAKSYAGVLSQDVCFAHTCPPQPDLAKRLASAG